jgi:hypothetical protein
MKKFKVTFNLYKHLGYDYVYYEVTAANVKAAEKQARRLHKEAIKTNYRLNEYNIGETKVEELK